MSWSHAITKVAQHNLSPTEQALNNVSGRVYVLDTTICTRSEALRVPSLYHDAPAVRQVVHYHPFLQPRHQLQLVSRIVGSDVFCFFAPCQAWFLPPLQLHNPSLRSLEA
jgi:hypothetical protein